MLTLEQFTEQYEEASAAALEQYPGFYKAVPVDVGWGLYQNALSPGLSMHVLGRHIGGPSPSARCSAESSTTTCARLRAWPEGWTWGPRS